MRPGQGKNIQETKKRNIQIINNLKQTLSKPTIVEAQRTLKIIEKLIDRVHVFMNLDSDFVVKFNQVSNPQKLKLNKQLINQLSPQVLDLLVKQAKMEIQFKGYASIQQSIKEGDEVESQKINEYNRVKKDMQYNFKSLLRALQKNPQDIQILKSLKSSSASNNEVVNVHQALCNYKIIMQKKLATAAQEQDSHTRLIEELNMKIASLQKTKINCQNDLLKLRQDRAKHNQDKKEQIDKLRSQIKQVQNFKDRQLEKIAKENKQMSEALTKQHKSTQDKLKSDITAERLKLNKLREEHQKQQVKLKSDKSSNESHLMDMIATYDKQMFTLTNNKNESHRQLKRISDELNNLKRHFKEIEEQRKREQALLEADRKRKQRWQMLEKRKGEAATKIKQAFRLFKIKNKKKKKKKK